MNSKHKKIPKISEDERSHNTLKPTRFSCDRTPHKQPGILKTEIATSFLSLTQSKTVLAIDTMKATKRNKTKTMFRLLSSINDGHCTRPSTIWHERARVFSAQTIASIWQQKNCNSNTPPSMSRNSSSAKNHQNYETSKFSKKKVKFLQPKHGKHTLLGHNVRSKVPSRKIIIKI